MTRLRSCILLVVVALLCLAGFPSSLAAQSDRPFTVSLLGGLGGAVDADPDAGLGNPSLQLGFAWLTDRRSSVGVRLGRLDMDGEQVEQLFDPELTYLTIAGEYRYRDRFYDAGVFAGVGGYRLEGASAVGNLEDEAFGVHLGVSGDFGLTPRFSILLEITGHWADLPGTQLFVLGHGGVAFRF